MTSTDDLVHRLKNVPTQSSSDAAVVLDVCARLVRVEEQRDNAIASQRKEEQEHIATARRLKDAVAASDRAQLLMTATAQLEEAWADLAEAKGQRDEARARCDALVERERYRP